MIDWNQIMKYANHGSPKPLTRVEKTEEQWRKKLTEEQFRVCRLKGTEAPHSGEFCAIFDQGLYQCVCCQTTLFDASIKIKSNSGWPSFSEPISDTVVKYEKDESFGMVRVEVMCSVCDAHLGHVFPDGPPPSELRFCINSVALAKKS